VEKVKQVSQQLDMLLSSLAPSRERAMVLRWKEELELYGERRANRQKVLSAIAVHYDTLNEIASDTKIPRSTCYKILQRLLKEGTITRTKVICPGSNCYGRNTEYRYALSADRLPIS
jgi:uncharacterized membrane protein